jgi:cytochrome c-type biogenesis protein CcmH
MMAPVGRCAGALLAALAVAWAATPAVTAQTTGRTAEETLLDRQTREVTAQLRCVVCPGVSLQASPSQLAQEMRALVREKLAQGMTPDEVKVYFVERYGEWARLEPDPEGFNLVVYIMPVLMLLGGTAFLLFNVRKWTAARPRPQTDTADVSAEV